jgi:2-aminoadipate transaminase
MVLTLDSGLDKPLYAQIRDQIRERILSGALKVGDRLEPSRELAKRLGVHRTTIGNAYADLEAEGLIVGTVGRGTFVSPLAAHLQARKAHSRRANNLFWEGFLTEGPRDDSLARLLSSAFEPGVISFAMTRSSEELSPVDLVRRVTDAVWRREGAKLLQYGSTDGYAPLKQFLQSRLGRDGIFTEECEILITSGCQQSLDLVRRSLLSPGDTVACENPTYTGLWNLLQSTGIRMIAVPVGAEGLDLDYLEAALERNKVKLILCCPTFHNPTGHTMPLAARKRLLEIARRAQVPVVEDDIYGALRYRGRELPPLKALDTSGMVIYVNSFSKVGFPGLRVGWMVAAPRVIECLRWTKQSADLHTNLLAQAVLEELGRRGWLDKLIRRTRKAYAQKLGLLLECIRRCFPPEARVIEPEGGMSVWVELPEDVDAAELLTRARDRGVIFAPGRYFYFQDVRHNALRLCFTSLTNEQIEQGAAVLGEVLKEGILQVRRTDSKRRAAAGVALV